MSWILPSKKNYYTFEWVLNKLDSYYAERLDWINDIVKDKKRPLIIG